MNTGEDHYPPPRHRRPLSEPPSPDDTGEPSAWFQQNFGSEHDQQQVPEGAVDATTSADFDRPRMPGSDPAPAPQPPQPQPQPPMVQPPAQQMPTQQPGEYPQGYNPGPNTGQFAQVPPGYGAGYQTGQHQFGQIPQQGYNPGLNSGQYPAAQPQANTYQTGPLDGLRKGPLPLVGAVVALLAAAGLIGWMFSGSGGDQEVTIGGSQADGASGASDSADAAELPPLSPAQLPPANEPGLVGWQLSLIDPYTGTGSTGTVELYMNSITGEVCHTFDVASLQGRYHAYLHEAQYPQEGPVVVDLGEVANSVPRCVQASPIEVTTAMAEASTFYVAAHGPDRSVVLRSQIADGEMVFDNRDPELLASQQAAREAAEQAAGNGLFSEGGEGAYLIVDAGKVTFEGAVPDQATADKLQAAFIQLSGMDVEVVDNLVVQAGAPAPSGRVIVADALLFGTGQDQISGDSPVLETLANLMIVNPSWTMTITGHTDNVGEYLLNIDLSLRRANNVRDRLAELDVPAERIRVQGAGPEQPIDSNDTAEGRARNRRIEISIDS